MHIRSYAKINWSLRITAKRADGYHDLETLFQTISLHDELTITPAERLSLECDDHGVPTDDTNLVIRAARAIGAPPVRIELKKRIPAGGGLGGGSSNAAATLIALDSMFGLHARLPEISLSLGSDVPFFLVGGTAYATGRGEKLTRLPAAAPIPLLLVLPEERVSTAEAFSLIGSYSKPVGIERYREILEEDLLAHGELLTNDFEQPVFARIPKLREYKHRLLAAGAAWAGMSGSGSTIVGAFRSQALRDAAVPAFQDVRSEPAETIDVRPRDFEAQART
ncbi:MAG TPA: 4-(cytidine 5'-diphospho)-2-C-methyl-D-erythritol kinase [Thermoanaerobaculia bacterium]|nr:4-(cytidine 5'-diphospho)-2-C-methyl-D-erythritol kinase [Thermoanaerobaculia bacterium]